MDKLDLSLDDIIKARPKGGGKLTAKEGAKGGKPTTPYARGGAPPGRGGARGGGQGGGRARGGPPSGGGQNCRVYVGNLDWSVGWQDVKDVMRSAGNVVSADVLYEPSGRSKGCALVQFGSPEAAQCAIDTLQDVQIGGRPIFVREDREAADVAAGGAQAGRRSSAPLGTGNARVFVGNLSWEVTAADLQPIMCSAGKVLSVDVLYEPGGRSKGCAMVSFANEAGAYKAIATLRDLEVCGRPIWLREDREA
jgi:RNA recognition motif-containing protein